MRSLALPSLPARCWKRMAVDDSAVYICGFAHMQGNVTSTCQTLMNQNLATLRPREKDHIQLWQPLPSNYALVKAPKAHAARPPPQPLPSHQLPVLAVQCNSPSLPANARPPAQNATTGYVHSPSTTAPQSHLPESALASHPLDPTTTPPLPAFPSHPPHQQPPDQPKAPSPSDKYPQHPHHPPPSPQAPQNQHPPPPVAATKPPNPRPTCPNTPSSPSPQARLTAA